MSKRTVGWVALCGWLMAGGALSAHHSLAGVYDLQKELALSGSLTKLEFVNPHSTVHVAVKNPDGSTTEWVMLTASNAILVRNGIVRSGPNGLKAGDVITIKCFPAKNGNPFWFVKSVVLPDQREVKLWFGDND